MRAALDTNVIVSTALTGQGTPASILRAWIDGAFDLIAFSLADGPSFEGSSRIPRVRRYGDAVEAAALVELVWRHG